MEFDASCLHPAARLLATIRRRYMKNWHHIRCRRMGQASLPAKPIVPLTRAVLGSRRSPFVSAIVMVRSPVIKAAL